MFFFFVEGFERGRIYVSCRFVTVGRSVRNVLCGCARPMSCINVCAQSPLNKSSDDSAILSTSAVEADFRATADSISRSESMPSASPQGDPPVRSVFHLCTLSSIPTISTSCRSALVLQDIVLASHVCSTQIERSIRCRRFPVFTILVFVCTVNAKR